jgi:hypothetical protein
MEYNRQIKRSKIVAPGEVLASGKGPEEERRRSQLRGCGYPISGCLPAGSALPEREVQEPHGHDMGRVYPEDGLAAARPSAGS